MSWKLLPGNDVPPLTVAMYQVVSGAQARQRPMTPGPPSHHVSSFPAWVAPLLMVKLFATLPLTVHLRIASAFSPSINVLEVRSVMPMSVRL